jgi:hypothetical protein
MYIFQIKTIYWTKKIFKYFEPNIHLKILITLYIILRNAEAYDFKYRSRRDVSGDAFYLLRGMIPGLLRVVRIF